MFDIQEQSFISLQKLHSGTYMALNALGRDDSGNNLSIFIIIIIILLLLI